jgi:hypothetical protein
MKHIIFYRESNKFDDILKDISLKGKIHYKLKWLNHLNIGLSDQEDDGIITYINIKYGDYIKTMTEDYSPKPNIDYIPIRK